MAHRTESSQHAGWMPLAPWRALCMALTAAQAHRVVKCELVLGEVCVGDKQACSSLNSTRMGCKKSRSAPSRTPWTPWGWASPPPAGGHPSRRPAPHAAPRGASLRRASPQTPRSLSGHLAQCPARLGARRTARGRRCGSSDSAHGDAAVLGAVREMR